MKINYDATSTPRQLTRDEACTIASGWHGGQWDPIYAFSSTGCVQSEDHQTEILFSIRKSMRWVLDNWFDLSEPNSPQDIQNLADLLVYVQYAPIEGVE